MWHVGIDLHRETVVIAAVNDTGEVMKPVTIRCEDTEAIVERGQGVGTVSGGDRGQRNLSLAVRSAPSARHDPLGPSVSSAGHGTTPHARPTSWTPNCWRICCGSTRFRWPTFRRSPISNCAT